MVVVVEDQQSSLSTTNRGCFFETYVCHFLANFFERPEICADLDAKRKNPGTFGKIRPKVACKFSVRKCLCPKHFPSVKFSVRKFCVRNNFRSKCFRPKHFPSEKKFRLQNFPSENVSSGNFPVHPKIRKFTSNAGGSK